MKEKGETSLLGKYFEYHKIYTGKYGKRCIILMEVGSFFEAYATNEMGFDLLELSKLLNVIRTKKSSKILTVDMKNPYMLGFPSPSLLDKLQIMTDNGITVVVIKQKSLGKEPTREVYGIYTAGTNVISYTSDSSNIVAIYVKQEKSLSVEPVMAIGIASCDVTTGKVCVHETYSNKEDDKFCLDEVTRFLQTYKPTELLLCIDSSKYSTDTFKSYWGLSAYNLKIVDKMEQHFTKIAFQTEFLKKIYPEHGLTHPIEYIDMTKTPYCLACFTMLLDYIYTINANIISKINVPTIYDEIQMLYIGNNATSQLNVFNNGIEMGNKKIRCLLDIVDNTSTPMGKRYLIERLNAPLINLNALQRNYDIIEYLINNNVVEEFTKILTNISDIEKYQRKMVLGVIRMDEFYTMVNSIDTCRNLLQTILDNKGLVKFFNISKKPEKLLKLLKNINQLFEVSNLKSYTCDAHIRIYKESVHDDIDEIYATMNSKMSFMDELKIALSNLLGGNDKLTIKKTSRDGYYFCTTRKRGNDLQEKLKKQQTIKIGTLEIQTSQFSYSNPSVNITKINLPEIDVHSDDIVLLEKKLNELINKHFQEDIKKIVHKYGKLITSISSIVAECDYIVSNAKTSCLYHYVKPTLMDTEHSFIDCQKMRHPIIERIIEHEYIPHDICIGKPDFKGMLLYGLNSSGKSSMMKALGLTVIMAQSGMYVPAKSMTYSPYNAIFTRVSGNDNLFRELSSFGVEMLELKAILNRANQKTLVIGDEVCRGTEHISGNAIVATTIIKLANVNATFIFATHLHDIVKLKQVQKIKSIKAFHLSVEHNPITDELVYDRQLKDGSGVEVYGVTVAKHIIRNDDFVKMANEIKDELIGYHDKLLQTSTSKYNSGMYVHECHVCHAKLKYVDGVSTLDTHHINQQKDCIDGFVINKEHIKKNSLANLVILCKSCHNKVHDKLLTIDGYIVTSNGKQLKMSDVSDDKKQKQPIKKSVK